MSTKGFLDLLNNNIKENIKIAEIGVAEGHTTLSYCELLKKNNSIGYAVDWFCGNLREVPTHPHGYTPDKTSEKLLLFENNLKYYIDNGTIKVVNSISWKAASLFEDNFFDIIYIDAGHTYTFCKSDILAWAPKVKVGGIISGDDYTYAGDLSQVPITCFEQFESWNGHIGVVKAVKECLGTNFQLIDNVWYTTMTEELKSQLKFLLERHTFPNNFN